MYVCAHVAYNLSYISEYILGQDNLLVIELTLSSGL